MKSPETLEKAIAYARDNKGVGRVQSREGRGLPQDQPVYSPGRAHTVPPTLPAKKSSGERLVELKDSIQEEIKELEEGRDYFETNRDNRDYIKKIVNAKNEVAEAERALRDAKARLAEAEMDRGPFHNYLDTIVEADRIVGAIANQVYTALVDAVLLAKYDCEDRRALPSEVVKAESVRFRHVAQLSNRLRQLALARQKADQNSELLAEAQLFAGHDRVAADLKVILNAVTKALKSKWVIWTKWIGAIGRERW
jgi:hypothetical protein